MCTWVRTGSAQLNASTGTHLRGGWWTVPMCWWPEHACQYASVAMWRRVQAARSDYGGPRSKAEHSTPSMVSYQIHYAPYAVQHGHMWTVTGGFISKRRRYRKWTQGGLDRSSGWAAAGRS